MTGPEPARPLAKLRRVQIAAAILCGLATWALILGVQQLALGIVIAVLFLNIFAIDAIRAVADRKRYR